MVSIRRLHYTDRIAASRLRWAVIFSVVVHVGAVVAISLMHGGTAQREFFSPIHMVEFSDPGPSPPAPAPARSAPPPPPPPKADPTPAKPVPPVAGPPPQVEKVLPLEPTEEPPRKERERTEEDLQKRLEAMRRKYDVQPNERTEGQGNEEDVRSAIERLRQRHAQTQETAPTQTATNNQGATGARTSGYKSTLQQMQYSAYYNRLWAHVNKNWKLPPSLNPQGLTAIVAVVIDRDGNIRHHELEESSGNEVYDESAIKALLRATPLPPIPSDIEEDVLEVGFRFRK